MILVIRQVLEYFCLKQLQYNEDAFHISKLGKNMHVYIADIQTLQTLVMEKT
jgi:hypothetical protein